MELMLLVNPTSSAMKHAQNMILKGSKAGTNLPYAPFRLDDDFEKNPADLNLKLKSMARTIIWILS